MKYKVNSTKGKNKDKMSGKYYLHGCLWDLILSGNQLTASPEHLFVRYKIHYNKHGARANMYGRQRGKKTKEKVTYLEREEAQITFCTSTCSHL